MKTFIQTSNSSYGKYLIRISSTEIKYFWKKADAIKYQESIREYLEAYEDALQDPAGIAI